MSTCSQSILGFRLHKEVRTHVHSIAEVILDCSNRFLNMVVSTYVRICVDHCCSCACVLQNGMSTAHCPPSTSKTLTVHLYVHMYIHRYCIYVYR